MAAHMLLPRLMTRLKEIKYQYGEKSTIIMNDYDIFIKVPLGKKINYTKIKEIKDNVQKIVRHRINWESSYLSYENEEIFIYFYMVRWL